MPWFGFIVCGENYSIKLDDEPPRLMGFYVHRFVEAATEKVAQEIAFEDIRGCDHLNSLIVDGGASNPTMHIDKTHYYDQRPDGLVVELGDQPTDIYYEFFPMNEEPEL